MLRAGPLDLHHLGTERVIGAYLVETDDGLALFDCGPSSCLPSLKERLAEQGVSLADVRHLLLSHIHLDHAGAAGALVRENRSLRVHVSEVGAPHLVDPARLESSARRLYGEAFDDLWGELAPVPSENVRVVGEDVLGLQCFPAPGHAEHHVVYVDRTGTAFCGDAAGVRIKPAELVLPPTPPPQVDVEAWRATLDELARRAPKRLALVHFGVAEDVADHLGRLRERLDAWAIAVSDGVDEAAFVERETASIEAVPDEHARRAYAQAMPLWQSYAGLRRWAEQSAAA